MTAVDIRPGSGPVHVPARARNRSGAQASRYTATDEATV